MKKPAKIAGIVVVAVVILMAFVNQFLWAHSYAYVCWRVIHPFGPDVKAFEQVVSRTEPGHIPDLIAKIDGPDGWWVESVFSAWFPKAKPPQTGKRIYWNRWWKDHQLEHELKLILHHDPQF